MFQCFITYPQRLQEKSNYTVKLKSSVMYAMSSDEISNLQNEDVNYIKIICI